MSTRHKLLYAASVAACFLIGCIAALALQAYDAREASPTPLPEGQTIDFSAYGFTLTVPETYSLNDYTANNLSEGDNALFAGCTYDAEGELYICLQAHTSQEGWEPPAISALWAPASEGGQEDPPVTEAET